MKSLTEPKLLIEVYKTLVSQDQFYTDLFERRIAFYVGLITAIFTGIAYVLLSDVDSPMSTLLLTSAGIIIIIVAHTGYLAGFRVAHRIKRNISELAKVEQALGLTVPPGKRTGDLYWGTEAIVATEHLHERSRHLNSQAFVDAQMDEKKENSFSRTAMFYKSAKLIGFLVVILSLVLN